MQYSAIEDTYCSFFCSLACVEEYLISDRTLVHSDIMIEMMDSLEQRDPLPRMAFARVLNQQRATVRHENHEYRKRNPNLAIYVSYELIHSPFSL